MAHVDRLRQGTINHNARILHNSLLYSLSLPFLSFCLYLHHALSFSVFSSSTLYLTSLHRTPSHIISNHISLRITSHLHKSYRRSPFLASLHINMISTICFSLLLILLSLPLYPPIFSSIFLLSSSLSSLFSLHFFFLHYSSLQYHSLIAAYYESNGSKVFTSEDYMAVTPDWALYKVISY